MRIKLTIQKNGKWTRNDDDDDDNDYLEWYEDQSECGK